MEIEHLSILDELRDNLNEYVAIYDLVDKRVKFTSNNLQDLFEGSNVELTDIFTIFLTPEEALSVSGQVLNKLSNLEDEEFIALREGFSIDKQSFDFKNILLECRFIRNIEVVDLFISIVDIDQFIHLEKHVIHDKEKRISEYELERLREQNKHLKEQVMYDEVTGIFNKLYFELRISEELERNQRYQGSLSLILIEVDNFGEIIERHGRESADIILKSIANNIASIIKKPDVFAKWSDNQFIILLPQTNLLGAYSCAERLRKRVNIIEHYGMGNVTASFGAAEKGYGESLSRWFHRVIALLDKAKNRGMNRVEVEKLRDYSPLASLRLSWRVAWSSGDNVIDIQHRYLIRVVNQLSFAVLSSADNNVINGVIDDLIKHLTYHFRYEEDIMLEVGFPSLKTHGMIHNSLIADLKEMISRYRCGSIEYLELFNFILRDLVNIHMVQEDSSYFPYLRD